MKPIILPELIDKGDSIEGIPWRQPFIWGEPWKSGIGTWDGQSHAGWIYPLSLRLPVYPEVFLNSLPGKKKGQPCCRTVEILRETAAPICPRDCWILYTMLAAYDALLFCLNKEKKATHVKGLLLTHFSAFLVISGALPATEGTFVAFLLLHLCSHYDLSHSVLICVDSHVIEGSGIDEQKISQRLFSVAICLLPVWFLSINTFE